MARPTNKKECKAFIGACAFYSTAIPLLQFVLSPLHSITGTKSEFDWADAQEESFLEAKRLLSSCGPIGFPTNEKGSSIILTTDASDKGYGAVLSETQADGTERPLGFLSGTFRDAQERWIIREKELYAFFHGVEYFYPQLLNRAFIWRTDNRSISTLADASLRTKASGAPNAKVIRWLEFLAGFDYSIEHHKGSEDCMKLADCLSRLHSGDKNTQNVNTISLLELPFWCEAGIPLVSFIEAQNKDTKLTGMVGCWSRFKKLNRRIYDGAHQIEINGKWLFMVPERLVESLFDFYHCKSHLNQRHMEHEIRPKFFLPTLRKKILHYISTCEKCVMVKKQAKQPRVKIKTTTSPGPWINAQVDLIGPFTPTLTGKRYILTFIDEFSSWIELRSLEDRSAESVLKALDQIFSIRGPTLNLQTDKASEFTSELVQKYLRNSRVYWNQICPYKPTTNGKVERMNGKIKVALRLSDATELNWDESLPSLQLSLNLTRQKCGYSAFQLIHGWTISRPAWLVTEQKRKGTNCDLPDDKKVAWARNAVARMVRVFDEKVGHENALKAAVIIDKLTNTFEDLKKGQRWFILNM